MFTANTPLHDSVRFLVAPYTPALNQNIPVQIFLCHTGEQTRKHAQFGVFLVSDRGVYGQKGNGWILTFSLRNKSKRSNVACTKLGWKISFYSQKINYYYYCITRKNYLFCHREVVHFLSKIQDLASSIIMLNLLCFGLFKISGKAVGFENEDIWFSITVVTIILRRRSQYLVFAISRSGKFDDLKGQRIVQLSIVKAGNCFITRHAVQFWKGCVRNEIYRSRVHALSSRASLLEEKNEIAKQPELNRLQNC